MTERREKDIKVLRLQYTIDLQRAKDAWIAAEKVRLQKLASTKEDEIKLQAIKVWLPNSDTYPIIMASILLTKLLPFNPKGFGA